MDLFDEKIYEVQHEEKRLILRRNPVRRLEQGNTRNSKLESLKCFIENKNVYLTGGPNRKVEVAQKHINKKISNYKFSSWIQLLETDRVFSISIDETAAYAGAKFTLSPVETLQCSPVERLQTRRSNVYRKAA